MREITGQNNSAKVYTDVLEDNCFLTGKYTQDYLHDMKICQKYADENRKMIAKNIIETYGLEPVSAFTTVHNYIDHDSKIIRKGAVSAKAGEKLLIPINMRGGSYWLNGRDREDVAAGVQF